MQERPRVLLTGATGFVGSHAYATLESAGYEVLGATRTPDLARQRFPGRNFVEVDLERPETLGPALRGCDSAVYLVHSMRGSDANYAERERAAALAFQRAAADARLRHIVYLGGVLPAGTPSKHLRSRLETGRCLRLGPTPVTELRAAMVIGAGSESFRMVRDLAARLPCMLLPRWALSLSEPVAIADVAHAIAAALPITPESGNAIYGLPGPEALSAKEILRRTAELLGREPAMVDVPFVSPRLSSYWMRFITRADAHIAEELVKGLEFDLLCSDPSFWNTCPAYARQPFDVAVKRALAAESSSVSETARVWEQVIRSIGPRQGL